MYDSELRSSHKAAHLLLFNAETINGQSTKTSGVCLCVCVCSFIIKISKNRVAAICKAVHVMTSPLRAPLPPSPPPPAPVVRLSILQRLIFSNAKGDSFIGERSLPQQGEKGTHTHNTHTQTRTEHTRTHTHRTHTHAQHTQTHTTHTDTHTHNTHKHTHRTHTDRRPTVSYGHELGRHKSSRWSWETSPFQSCQVLVAEKYQTLSW